MADHSLDIRGLVCPITRVRVRQALGTLPAGARLEVLLDHRPALPDIRRNSAELGHELLRTEPVEGGVWRLLLEVGQAD